MSPAAPASLGDDTTAKGTDWIRWLVIVQLIYWGVFAVVLPVTNYDSQVYNLARLAVANVGGLFGNLGWTNPRQIVFPWTFDSIHYPFLFLGWGYCLPSFACFVGLLIIVHRLTTGATGSPRAGWWCSLALLAMPTMVYQAVNTKNDLAVVFGVGCWYYAWRLWRGERRRVYLFLMALALGFTAGAKTTGLLYAALLGVFSVYRLRIERTALVRFCAWMAVAILLLGSVETYLNNQRLFQSPFGPRKFVAQNQNRDGLPGASASFIRYCFSSMSVGVDAANPAAPTSRWLEDRCRSFLDFVGLKRDLGYRSDFNEGDANMVFSKTGGSAGSDFGPIGALALLGGFFFVLAWPPSDPLWKLSVAGFVSLGIVAYTVAWMTWNMRFLLLPFSLFTIALTLGILRLGDCRLGRFVRSVFALLAVFSSVIYAETAFAHYPAMMWTAIRHRPVAEMTERPGMLQIVRDLRQRADPQNPPTLLVQAGDDSWLLCITEVAGMHVLPRTVVNEQDLSGLRETTGHVPVYVLAVDSPLSASLQSQLTLVKSFDGASTALYRWQPETAKRP